MCIEAYQFNLTMHFEIHWYAEISLMEKKNPSQNHSPLTFWEFEWNEMAIRHRIFIDFSPHCSLNAFSKINSMIGIQMQNNCLSEIKVEENNLPFKWDYRYPWCLNNLIFKYLNSNNLKDSTFFYLYLNRYLKSFLNLFRIEHTYKVYSWDIFIRSILELKQELKLMCKINRISFVN